MKMWSVKLVELLGSRLYFFSLAVATIVYFIAIRLFQDNLTYSIPSYLDPYPGYPLLPEPYEIPLYLAGYAVIPVMALGVCWVFGKVYSLCHSHENGNPNKNTKTNRSFLFSFGFLDSRSKPGMTITRTLALIGFFIPLIVVGIYLLRPDLFHFVISYFQRRSIWHLLWLLFTKRIYIVQIAFMGAFVAFVFSYWKRWSFVDRVQKMENWNGWKWLVPSLGVALAIIIFHPNFPAQDGFANYIVGPAFEATQGRPLLYETFSLYGILNTYLVTFLFKLGLPATFKSLTLVIMAGYAVFFFLLYRFFKTWLNSRLFAVIGTWASVVLGFFLLSDPYVTAYEFIGQTAYRQGFFIVPVLFVALFWNYRKHSESRYFDQASLRTRGEISQNAVRKYDETLRQAQGDNEDACDDNRGWLFRELALLSSAIGLFWNTETGVYAIITTCAVFVYWELIQFHRTTFSRLTRAVFVCLRQVCYSALMFFAVSIGNYIAFHEFPHWTQQLKLMSMFESGYGKLPLPAIGLFELHVFVYLGFLVWVISRFLKRETVELPVVFLAVYGPFALLYYVGNSAWSYLNFVSIPMTLLVVYGFYCYFRNNKNRHSELDSESRNKQPKQKDLNSFGVSFGFLDSGSKPGMTEKRGLRVMNSVFFAFLTFFLILTFAKVPVVFAGRNYSDINLETPEPKFQALYEDAKALKRLTPEKAIPVLHEDDGRLLLWTDKVNYFYVRIDDERLTSLYDDAQVIYQRQVRDFVEQLEQGRPRYVIVGNKPDARFEDFLKQIQGSYMLEKGLKTLKVYRRIE